MGARHLRSLNPGLTVRGNFNYYSYIIAENSHHRWFFMRSIHLLLLPNILSMGDQVWANNDATNESCTNGFHTFMFLSRPIHGVLVQCKCLIGIVIHRNRNFDSGRNRYRNERLPAGTGTETGIATGIQEFTKSYVFHYFSKVFSQKLKVFDAFYRHFLG